MSLCRIQGLRTIIERGTHSMIEQHSIGSKGHTVLTPDLGVKWPVLARVPTGMRYKVDWWSGRGQDLSDTCGGFARTQTGRGARRLWSGE